MTRLNRNLIIGGLLVLLSRCTALVALVWTPYPPSKLDILHKLAQPSATHWLGTDAFGRDVLSMIMAGTQTSLSVSLLAVSLGAGIGVPLGALAASAGGWVDALIMRSSDLACPISASAPSRRSQAGAAC